MLTTRYPTVEVELVKWVLLLALAIAMMLLMATAIGAAEPMTAPATLPDDMGLFAKPMRYEPPVFPENPTLPEAPACEVAAQLWMILEHHRAGCFGEALAGWNQVTLPPETAVWQTLAQAAGYLQAGDFERAVIELDLARHLAPDHPVVAYYTGILRLEQAAAAARAPEGYDAGNLRLVAYLPPRGAEAAELYRALARTELGHAIARAGAVRLDQPLIGVAGEEVVAPRVGDLLVALGADNFLGKAHHLLFKLELDRGEAARAEHHLDAAVATGLAPLFGYGDLTQAYVDAGRAVDAVRVAQKDLRANYPALWEACQELQAAWQRTGTLVW